MVPFVTAPKSTGANAPATASETSPKDLSHIRVGPRFTARFAKACILCREDVAIGESAAIIENARTAKKQTVHEACLEARPDLMARRESETAESFLA